MRPVTCYLLLVTCHLLPAAAQPPPLRWEADTSVPRAAAFSAYRGETKRFQPVYVAGGAPVSVSGFTSTFYWSTNGVQWWSRGPGPDPALTVTGDPFTWTPAMDCGASSYTFFIRAVSPDGETAYAANGTLKMLASPGAIPNTLPLPQAVIDFSSTAALNAPWFTASDAASLSNALAAALQSEAQARAGADAALGAGLSAHTDDAARHLTAQQALRIGAALTNETDALALSALATQRVDRIQTADGSRWIDAAGGVWRVVPETNWWVEVNDQMVMWDEEWPPEWADGGHLEDGVLFPLVWEVPLHPGGPHAAPGSLYAEALPWRYYITPDGAQTIFAATWCEDMAIWEVIVDQVADAVDVFSTDLNGDGTPIFRRDISAVTQRVDTVAGISEVPSLSGLTVPYRMAFLSPAAATYVCGSADYGLLPFAYTTGSATAVTPSFSDVVAASDSDVILILDADAAMRHKLRLPFHIAGTAAGYASARAGLYEYLRDNGTRLRFFSSAARYASANDMAAFTPGELVYDIPASEHGNEVLSWHHSPAAGSRDINPVVTWVLDLSKLGFDPSIDCSAIGTRNRIVFFVKVGNNGTLYYRARVPAIIE
jgi:hypothetical protein